MRPKKHPAAGWLQQRPPVPGAVSLAGVQTKGTCVCVCGRRAGRAATRRARSCRRRRGRDSPGGGSAGKGPGRGGRPIGSRRRHMSSAPAIKVGRGPAAARSPTSALPKGHRQPQRLRRHGHRCVFRQMVPHLQRGLRGVYEGAG